MKKEVPHIQLGDGNTMPQLGLGVWQASNEEAAYAVKCAIEAGYSMVDTAATYKNEKGVGEGIKQANVNRDDIFVTTKLWNSEHGLEKTPKDLKNSLRKLGLDYVDLYLIHWPVPEQDRYVEAWQAMIDLQKQGLTKSIGVANFTEAQLKRLIDETGVKPVVNQIEIHPYFQQQAMRDVNRRLNIATESYSPLASGNADLPKDPLIMQLAEKYGKSPYQIIIRWHIENGLIVIPKAVQCDQIKQNIDVFDFKLTNDDLNQMETLNKDLRTGGDPDTMNYAESQPDDE